jgi:hypothetical protein
MFAGEGENDARGFRAGFRVRQPVASDKLLLKVELDQDMSRYQLPQLSVQ